MVVYDESRHLYECSVLQCVAVCCRVLQCVAMCCNVLQCVAVCCSVLLQVVQRMAYEESYHMYANESCHMYVNESYHMYAMSQVIHSVDGLCCRWMMLL